MAEPTWAGDHWVDEWGNVSYDGGASWLKNVLGTWVTLNGATGAVTGVADDPTAAGKYREAHLYGGPQGAGTYSVDANGNAISLIKLDTPSGGGGSTNPSTIYINQNPGGLVVQKTVPPEGDSSGLPPGTFYQENQVTGAITTIRAAPAVKGDNGINPTTNLPWDVYPDDKSSTGYAYFPKSGGAAVPVFKDGRDAASSGATYGGGAGAGSKTVTMYGPQGQGLYVVDANYNIIKYLGPTTAAGAGASSSSGGGSSSGGSSGGSSAGGGLSSPANRTNTTIHEGGYNDVKTTTNISEIGPVEAAIRASEFAANNALAKNKAQQESAALYAQLLSQVDPNAYQAFLETSGGGRLDNALLSGANALSANAINPAAMALEAAQGVEPAQAGGGLQMTTGGGGLQAEGGDPVSPGGGLPSAPAVAPAPNLMANGPSAESNGQMSFQTPEEMAAYIKQLETPMVGQTGRSTSPDGLGYYGSAGYQSMVNRQIYDGLGTQSVNPQAPGYIGAATSAAAPRPGYMTSAEMSGLANGAAVVDPRIAAQATDVRQRDIRPNAGLIDVVPQYAGGGLARGASIIGDPQEDGRPNPEMVVPEDPNARFRVIPLKNMPPQMAQRAMGGLPRHAYGTWDELNASLLWGQQATTQPEHAAEPAPQPASTYGMTTSQGQVGPVTLPPKPTTSAPAPQPVAAPDANNPAQIGTYSTAPGSAGEPVTQPAAGALPDVIGQSQAAPNAPQPATSVPASVVSGASGGSAQPSQAAFDETMYTRLAATNPWMSTPDAYMNIDYLSRDPVARRNYEQYLTMRFGVPQESIDFAQARNRLGGASMASMSQGR